MSQPIQTITFISTVHKEIGKCNADELCFILVNESPDVVFLEALENTYSKYDELKLSSFGVYHQKLEIKAIQKFNQYSSFVYIPVLESGLSELFDRKYNLVCADIEFQRMLDDFNLIASEKGFQFINSEESIKLQEKMRKLEYQLLYNNDLYEAVNKDIDAYENSMMRNIYSYCRDNQFEKAVFMCGVAHRRSIIEKIKSFISREKMNFNWVIWGN